MNHGQMDQGQMEGMDHSKMSMDARATTTEPNPIPVLTDADREAAPSPVAGHGLWTKASTRSFSSISSSIRTLTTQCPELGRNGMDRWGR